MTNIACEKIVGLLGDLHLYKIYEALRTTFVCPKMFVVLSRSGFCMQLIDKFYTLMWHFAMYHLLCVFHVGAAGQLLFALCCHLLAFGQFRLVASLLYCTFLYLYCTIHEICFIFIFCLVYYLRFGSIAFALIYHRATEINKSLWIFFLIKRFDVSGIQLAVAKTVVCMYACMFYLTQNFVVVFLFEKINVVNSRGFFWLNFDNFKRRPLVSDVSQYNPKTLAKNFFPFIS